MAEPFTNEPIPLDELPRLTDDAFVAVDPRYLRSSLVGTAITAAVVLVGGSIVASQADEAIVPIAITGAILVLIALSVVIRILEVRRLAYQLRDHDISMRSGVITHRVESLPFARVQHVRVNRGAIERALGLATLQISSAGPNITIPGLSEAEASRIKLLVTQRAGMDITDESVTEDVLDVLPPAPPAPPHAPPAPPVAPPAPASPGAPAAPAGPVAPAPPPAPPGALGPSAPPPVAPPRTPPPVAPPTAPPSTPPPPTHEDT